MRLIIKMFVVAAVCQFSIVKSLGQAVSKSLDQYYQALYLDHEMNGNVAASEHGKTIYLHSFGFADAALQRPNNKNSQFELASVSKLFTAIAVLQLKERGLVDLDRSFQYYFPEFPYAEITVRHLLAHSSGLPDIESLVDSLLAVNPAKQFTIHDDMQNIIIYSRGHHLLFQPGEQWSYSSAGYHLLGLLVEKISGQTLAGYTHEHIFLPAGMRHSYVQTIMLQKTQPNRTRNYQYSNHFALKLQYMDTLADWKEWTYNLALETGGGGIISTTDDMLRFDKAINAGKLLQANTQAEAYTPYRLNNGQPAQPFDLAYCGLGWFIMKDTLQGKIVWGSGANPGTISLLSRNLSRHQCLVVLHNIKCNPLNDIKALDILAGKPVKYRISLAFVYAQHLFANGPEQAQHTLDELRMDSLQYELRENEFDRAALEFRRAGLKSQALATGEQHIRCFPGSPRGYKDYALTLAEYGRKEEAITQYEKALVLNANDTETIAALNKLKEK